MGKLTTILLSAALVTVGYATTEGFAIAAGLLQSGLDESADPCNDFYQYTCGKWPATHNATDDFDSLTITTIRVLDMTGEGMMKYDPAMHPAAPYPYNQAGIMMHNCMDGQMSPIDDVAVANFFMDKLGGWPSVVGAYKNTVPGMAMGIDAFMMGMWGVSTVFGSSVEVNYWHPDREMGLLLAGQNVQWNGGPMVPNRTVVGYDYVNIVHRLQKASNMPLTSEDILLFDALEVANLEVEAYNATWSAMNWQMPAQTFKQYLKAESKWFKQPYNVKTAIQQWPNINWPQWLINVGLADNLYENILFGTSFHVAFPTYLDWVNNMIATTDDRIVRNWLMYRLAVQFETSFTPAEGIRVDGTEHKFSTKNRPSPAGYCANKIMYQLPFLVGKIYADESKLSQHDMNNLNEMIGLMLSSWRGMITEVPWMSDYSKQNAFDKIDNNVRNVAWPSWIQDQGALEAYYNTLNLTLADDKFTTAIKMARWQMSKQLTMLGKPVDRHAQSWSMGPSVVNAWYAPQLNSITFPAAIMSSPFYNASFPKAYNYAHMGAVMGHELGHGFDNSGVFWGPEGQYDNGSWFDPESKMGFEKMTECVVDEYNKECLMLEGKMHCVNGQMTLPENIADNGGLVASWRAFQAVMGLQGGENKIPQGYGKISELTEEQLFWFSFGNTWCSNEPDANVLHQMATDPHSPDPIRVRGTVQNVPDFAKAFNCPLGSKMNPTKHCHVWVK